MLTRILIAALVLALFFLAGAGWQKQRGALDQASAAAAMHQRANAASERARMAERRLGAAQEKTATDTRKENTHAQTVHQDFSRRLAAGTARVFVPAACLPATDQATTASGPEPGTGRAELSPAFAQALDALVTDADASSRERNQCLAAYSAAQATLKQWAESEAK